MTLKLNYKAATFIIIMSFLVAAVVLASHFLRYRIYEVVIEHPISGLAVDAPVEFNGVTVGSIASIKFDPQNPQKIIVVLHINRNTPISRGTVGKVDISEIITQKLTGFPYTYISLRDSGNSPEPILHAPDQYPLIPMSGVDNTTPSLVRLSQAVQKSNDSFSQLLTPENVESLKELIFSLQQLTNVLAKNSDKLDTLLVNTGEASKKFGPFLDSTNDTLLTLKTETLPQVYNLTQNANETLQSVQKLLGKINNNPTILVRGEALPKLGPGETESKK
ncbi:MAG TPA: MlaD family protein [Gammaproteobacteria bacterium]|nr:MlaD family protein [Gammaproteobacteria bacterium]